MSKKKNIIFLTLSVLIVLILLTFAVFKDEVKKIYEDYKIVVEVNEDRVTLREYKIRYNTLKENAIQFSSRTDILDQVFNGKTYRELLKENLFNVLIEELLCLQEAKKRNITLTAKEKNELKKYIDDIKSNSETNSYFVQYLKKIGSDEKHFFEDLCKTRIVNKVYNLVTNKITVEDKEIMEYYNTNKSNFRKIKVLDIFLKVNNETENIQKKKIADKIILELKNGKEFEYLLNKYLEYNALKDKNGLIDYFRRGEKESEFGSNFENEVFKLSIGQVSDVIKTLNGYHIVKIIGEKYMSIEEVKDELRYNLLRIKKEEFFKSYLENLKKNSKIKIYNENIINL